MKNLLGVGRRNQTVLRLNEDTPNPEFLKAPLQRKWGVWIKREKEEKRIYSHTSEFLKGLIAHNPGSI